MGLEDAFVVPFYSVLINLVFIIVIACITVMKSSIQSRQWNILYDFNEKESEKPVTKYLIQFRYFFDQITMDFAIANFTLTFLNEQQKIEKIRIPNVFFLKNRFNQPILRGEKVQFLFITNKNLSNITRISVNHQHKKGRLKMDSIIIQKTDDNEAHLVMIDKYIISMEKDLADSMQAFDTIKRTIALPESNLTIDSDHSIWIYIGPLYYLINKILLKNSVWCFRNFSEKFRRTARDFMEFEAYQYAVSEAVIQYMLCTSVSQMLYSLIYYMMSGKPKFPRNLTYMFVNSLFFLAGFRLVYDILDPDGGLSFAYLFTRTQSDAFEQLNMWTFMNIIGLCTCFFMVLPFHYFVYKTISKGFFREVNDYDLTVNEF